MSDLLSPWWGALLALIGAITVVTVILTLFFAFGRRPTRLTAQAPLAIREHDEFLRAIAGAANAPVCSGGTAEILHNGDGFFPALLRDIAAAERTVHFFTYIFEKGEIGARVLDALTERAHAGVQVRLLLDGFGAMDVDEERVRRLVDAGGAVAWYRPLRFGKLTRFHRRNHRRAIVIDGRIGYTGGAAVGDKWLGDARAPDEWREMMFRLTGSLARSVQATFAETWSNVRGEVLSGPDSYPADAEEEGGGVEIVRHVNVLSAPSDEAHPLRKLFWATFMGARERICLTTPYFVPDEHIRAALIDRARAGVDVRILLPNEHTDAKPIRYAARSHYEELLREGIRIYEFQPTFLHTKALVVDGIWSVIGSANMDIRSKELNDENAIGILDARFGAGMEHSFVADLARSREIDLDEWTRRGAGERALERFFMLFAEQY